jgi:hypothetical protein
MKEDELSEEENHHRRPQRAGQGQGGHLHQGCHTQVEQEIKYLFLGKKTKEILIFAESEIISTE